MFPQCPIFLPKACGCYLKTCLCKTHEAKQISLKGVSFPSVESISLSNLKRASWKTKSSMIEIGKRVISAVKRIIKEQLELIDLKEIDLKKKIHLSTYEFSYTYFELALSGSVISGKIVEEILRLLDQKNYVSQASKDLVSNLQSTINSLKSEIDSLKKCIKDEEIKYQKSEDQLKSKDSLIIDSKIKTLDLEKNIKRLTAELSIAKKSLNDVACKYSACQEQLEDELFFFLQANIVKSKI